MGPAISSATGPGSQLRRSMRGRVASSTLGSGRCSRALEHRLQDADASPAPLGEAPSSASTARPSRAGGPPPLERLDDRLREHRAGVDQRPSGVVTGLATAPSAELHAGSRSMRPDSTTTAPQPCAACETGCTRRHDTRGRRGPSPSSPSGRPVRPDGELAARCTRGRSCAGSTSHGRCLGKQWLLAPFACRERWLTVAHGTSPPGRCDNGAAVSEFLDHHRAVGRGAVDRRPTRSRTWGGSSSTTCRPR